MENSFKPQFDSQSVDRKTFSGRFDVRNKGFDVTSKDPTPGGGTDDYEELKHKPRINGVTLIGNKTPEDLNIDLENTSEMDFADIKHIWESAQNNV